MRAPGFLLFAFLILGLACATSHPAIADEKPQIESGFNMLYELRFEEARKQFSEWERANPADSLGHAAMAASYLFEEFYYQHVLTSEFFLDDQRLLGGIRGKPDERRKAGFHSENEKGKEVARRRLNEDPRDADALFVMTITTGMQADFASILEKHQMESLSLIKEAEGYARRLIALQPDDADAWLSLGAANYIVGCLPAYKRFFLWFGRIRGDKELGMDQLQIAAEKGHYLKPFAQIFLALAAMRENRKETARTQLLDLAAHFPENALFREELAHLDARNAGSRNAGQ
jgi:hypothetical protein